MKIDAQQQEDKLAWVYLVNLGFYLIPLFIQPYPLWQLILCIATLIPFLGCYFWAYRADKHSVIYPIIGIIALATVITPLNPGSISLFTFAGFFIGFHYKLTTSLLAWLGLIVLLAVLNYTLAFNNYYFVLYGSGLIAGVGLFGVAERKRQETKRRERQSAQEISALATMIERERIARDLHDIMGHSLSSITLKAELAEKLLQKGQVDSAQVQLHELTQIARESLSQIRHTVSEYKHKGLSACVIDISQLLRDKGLSVQLAGKIPTQLPARLESQLVLILTELSSNILRHSQGTECAIHFGREGNNLLLTVTDNGQPKPIVEGNGLIGIRERVTNLQGQFSYQTDEQYTFHFILPLLSTTEEHHSI